MTGYQFGDTDRAAERLAYLADIFAEPSRDFIDWAVHHRPRLAIDLGCGPGHTTRLLAECLDSACILGLDTSEHFIFRAERIATNRTFFRLHDVTRVPFPVGPADLLYCRFLLSHIEDPAALVRSWGGQLQVGGVLLIEEVEDIRTDNKTFAVYLEIVEALLADRSCRLYIGRELDRIEDNAGLRRQESRVHRLPVATHRAATMFHLNIQSWRHQPFVTHNYPAGLIDGIESELASLARHEGDASDIEWGLRQIVFG